MLRNVASKGSLRRMFSVFSGFVESCVFVRAKFLIFCVHDSKTMLIVRWFVPELGWR